MSFQEISPSIRGRLQDIEGPYCEILKRCYRDDLLKILQADDLNAHYPFYIRYTEIFDECRFLGELLLTSSDAVLELMDSALKKALCDLAEISSGNAIKPNVHTRVVQMPICDELYKVKYPTCNESGNFFSLSGTIVRVGTAKLLEYSRMYQCSGCKSTFDVKADSFRCHSFPKAVECPNSCMDGKVTSLAKAGSIDSEKFSKFKDYQEVKLQELVRQLDFRGMPKALHVILENDLVNSCKPGDDALITGKLYIRWKPLRQNQAVETELVFKANSVQINNNQRVILHDELSCFFDQFWIESGQNPLEGRNHIIKSFCPQICGMYIVKLALCVVLAGGVTRKSVGTNVRGESHILLVGDPGTGKSQLLKFASKICPRSVITTGIGTSSAGLTVSASKENEEWHLEAGALVLADGGVCCIDEFSCIKEVDRVSIHEAMEQQSISIAKAGMVVKLPTRVTVIAASNPKGKYDQNQSLSVNIGLSAPLLSRFDILMVLMDIQNYDWDQFISHFILEGTDPFVESDQSPDLWNIENLQGYFAKIRKFDPVMSQEANLAIAAYYQFQRSQEDRNAARTTVRLLESLRRLAEGHARLMYRNEVKLIDAVTAISLIESSSSTGNVSSVLHSKFPTNPIEDYNTQASIILGKLKLDYLIGGEQSLNNIPQVDLFDVEFENEDPIDIVETQATNMSSVKNERLSNLLSRFKKTNNK